MPKKNFLLLRTRFGENGEKKNNQNSFSNERDFSQNFDDDFISLTKAAFYCSYSQEYLSLLARKGSLGARKLGRNWVTRKEWLLEYLEKHPQDILAYKSQVERLKKEVTEERESNPSASSGQGKAREPKSIRAIVGFGDVDSSRKIVLMREPAADRIFYFFIKVLSAPVIFSLRFFWRFLGQIKNLAVLVLWGFGQGFIFIKNFFQALVRPVKFCRQFVLNLEHLTKLQQVKVCGLGVFVFSLILSLFLNLAAPILAWRFNSGFDRVGTTLITQVGQGARATVLTLVGYNSYLRMILPRVGEVVKADFGKLRFAIFRHPQGLMVDPGLVADPEDNIPHFAWGVGPGLMRQKVAGVVGQDLAEIVSLVKSRVRQWQNAGSHLRGLALGILFKSLDRYGQVAGVQEGVVRADNPIENSLEHLANSFSATARFARGFVEKVLLLGKKIDNKLLADIHSLNFLGADRFFRKQGQVKIFDRVANDVLEIAGISEGVVKTVAAAEAEGAVQVNEFSRTFESPESILFLRLKDDWQGLQQVLVSDFSQMRGWLASRANSIKSLGNEIQGTVLTFWQGAENNLGNVYLVASDLIHRSTSDDFYPFDGLVKETPRSLDKPVPTTPKLAADEKPIGVTGAGGEEIGAVVAPLTKEEAREEVENRLRESFSDEVKLKPDEADGSGVITPVYPATLEEKYLYVIVPVRE